MEPKRYLGLPAAQLNKYPVLLEAIIKETPEDHPDHGFLVEAIRVIRNMSLTAQLKAWQHSAKREDLPRGADAVVRRERAVNIATLQDKLWSDFVSEEEQNLTSDADKHTQQ